MDQIALVETVAMAATVLYIIVDIVDDGLSHASQSGPTTCKRAAGY